MKLGLMRDAFPEQPPALARLTARVEKPSLPPFRVTMAALRSSSAMWRCSVPRMSFRPSATAETAGIGSTVAQDRVCRIALNRLETCRSFVSASVASGNMPILRAVGPTQRSFATGASNANGIPLAPKNGRALAAAIGASIALSLLFLNENVVHAEGRGGSSETPWNPSDEFLRLLKRREDAENQLRELLMTQRDLYHKLAGAMKSVAPNSKQYRELEEALAALLSETESKTHALIYGPNSTPALRGVYLDTFGCTKPTDSAVAALKSLAKKVIEIGAGRGHWALALRKAGVDVLAVDDYSDIPKDDPNAAPVTYVIRGTHDLIPKNPDRTLLLVYPPPTKLAAEALKAYAGRLLFYVGEPRGGANANDVFFDELQRSWRVQKVVDIEPYEGGVEKLWILERRA
ncbi:hypothetical protein DFJ74DRAFT_76156 [Hyaloraphidium curvatum]|nr:hypothetical protein DFJ74DRAFT_76156 [Hyaloraphidium curvatum]